MGTYKNDYKKNEDECLWEIHEIRNKLHKEIKNETYEEINDKAKSLFEEIKQKYQKKELANK
jgi:hypothetical protein